MVKQVIKIGNSCGLILPAEEVEKLHLKPGDKVEVYSDGTSLRIVPVARIKAVKLGNLWDGVNISEDELRTARREAWREPFK